MSRSGYDKFFKAARKQASHGHAKKPRAQTNELSAAQVETLLRAKAGIAKTQKRNKFPWGLTIISALGVVVAALALFKADEIESFAHKVEIGWTTASASEGKAAAPAAHGDEAKTEDNKKNAHDVAEKREPSSDEIDHLSKLNDRKKSLDEREQEIARQEAELATMKAELEKKLADLENMRNKISEMLAERVKVDEQKLQTLVQMYSNMKPIQAAKIFETLDQDLAVEVLGKMKKKNAADIMNLLKPEKAQIFSERYAGYKNK